MLNALIGIQISLVLDGDHSYSSCLVHGAAIVAVSSENLRSSLNTIIKVLRLF